MRQFARVYVCVSAVRERPNTHVHIGDWTLQNQSDIRPVPDIRSKREPRPLALELPAEHREHRSVEDVVFGDLDPPKPE